MLVHPRYREYPMISAQTNTLSTLSDFSIRYPEMYSPLACEPNHHQITPVNATPHDTHTADSMAASRVVASWASL